jgi:GxxExxY protein
MRVRHQKFSYKVIGACFEVHRQLGCGFLEGVYQEALKHELNLRKVPFIKEKKININYKGKILDKYYYADFICYDAILIELKALSSLNSNHESQVMNYLKATSLNIGLLINFGTKSLVHKRYILQSP